MSNTISAYRDFPLGEVLGQDEGRRFNVTRHLRGGAAAGQYQGEDLGGRPGTYLVITIGPPQRRAREELERELSLRVSRVVPLRGIFPLTDRQGTRYQAMVEARPVGDPLVDRRWPLSLADSAKLGIELAETAEAAARQSMALDGIRPELTYVKEEGGQLELTAVVPRGEPFVARASGTGGSPALFSHRYAAPEVVLGQPGSAAGDVFSICALLAHVASGEYPFEGADPVAQLAAMQGGRRRAWTGPPSLGAVLDRGLSVDPDRRPTPSELIDELRDVTEPERGLGARLLSFLPRRGRDGDPPAEAGPARGAIPTSSRDPFPLGARIAGADCLVTERLAGERWRGRYRGRDGAGRSLLVTVAGAQTADVSLLLRELELDVPGIARLRAIGRVVAEAGGGAFDALVEDEPPGRPIAELMASLTPRAALAAGIGLAEIVARAHGSGQVIGGLVPEVIYLGMDGGQLVVTGVAPRAERFALTASRPSFALPDLFAATYHAPELLAGGGLSPADDVFAVSALTAEWMSGQFPFEGETYIARALAVQLYNRRPLALPEPIGSFLDRGLAREVEQRPSIAEWLSEARRLIESGL